MAKLPELTETTYLVQHEWRNGNGEIKFDTLRIFRRLDQAQAESRKRVVSGFHETCVLEYVWNPTTGSISKGRYWKWHATEGWTAYDPFASPTRPAPLFDRG